VAQAVCRLLGAQARPRFSRRLRDWPQLAQESEDFCQLAALAFLEAYCQGRIAPDAARGVHTAHSVAVYAFGICNRIFANAVRSSRPAPLSLEQAGFEQGRAEAAADSTAGPLDELLGSGPGDRESRLWEVLSIVEKRCRPEDIIVTYLLASGVSVGEIRRLLNLSTNVPANALRRVGQQLRELLEPRQSGGSAP